MVFIFNKLYGGDSTSVISDTVSIVSEAGILEAISNYASTDFYNQNQIENAIYKNLVDAFHDYYLTCTSVFIINMEYDYAYQNSIAGISAEAQKIVEKVNLLNGTQIQSKTSISVAQLEQIMSISTATNQGKVYSIVQASKATAINTYYGKVSTSLGQVQTFISGGAGVKDVYKFFYLVVVLYDEGYEDVAC